MQVDKVESKNFILPKIQGNNFQKKDAIQESLRKQMENIQKQLLAVTENKSLSIEQKKDIKKNLNEQLEEINKQMFERQLEIREEKQKQREKKIKENAIRNFNKDSEQGEITDFIRIATSMGKIKSQHLISLEMKGEARVLESEIKLDESRGLDVSEKKVNLSDIKDKLSKLSKKIGKSVKEVNNEVKKGEHKSDINHKYNEDDEVNYGVNKKEISEKNIDKIKNHFDEKI